MTSPRALAWSIPVGRNRELSLVYAVREECQHPPIHAIVRSPEFAYACNNPFTDGVRGSGNFTFLWYDRDDRLHADKFNSKGKCVSSTTTSRPDVLPKRLGMVHSE